MKFLIASDLHGDLHAAKRLLEVFRQQGADRLVLLGDLLYHGPRNDLPAGYDPKGAIALLNGVKDKILAVRGNCDTEVDQMVLEFPILADYAVIPLSCGALAYLTHGHKFNEQTPPPFGKNDVLLHGHSHVAGVTACRDGQVCLNPGSLSIPKENTPPCYILLENSCFVMYRLADGTEYARVEL